MPEEDQGANREALGMALGQFLADGTPQADPEDIQELTLAALAAYDKLVASGMAPSDAALILMKKAGSELAAYQAGGSGG